MAEECSVNRIIQLMMEYVVPRKMVGNSAATMSGH
jgi:hypothetical protein